MVRETRYRWTRAIGRFLQRTIDLLGSVSRRIGYPTLVGVPVSAAMLSRVVSVGPQHSLEDVAQLLVAGRHEQVPVLEDGRPIAVLTRSDVAHGLEVGGPHALVAAAPYHHAVSVAPTESIENVLDKLRSAPDTVAVVIDRGSPVGLVTATMLVAYMQTQKLA